VKQIIITVVFLIGSLSLFGQDSTATNFVLLELFTSQGCSSCPPADENIKLIGEKYRNENVYILSYHVDYWDYLGWKDSFSSRENSERQRFYARKKFYGKVYTPQFIVNGVEEFNGSDQVKTINAIAKFKDSIPKAIAEITTLKVKETVIEFNAKLSGDYSGCQLNIVLIENKLSTKILKGENRNKTIAYEHVVKNKISIPVRELMMGSIKIPSDFNLSNGELIIFLQDKNTLAVKGVTSHQLKPI